MKKILSVAVVLCASLFAFAQETNNVIQTAVPALNIAPDAVGGGMGDIGVATNPDEHSQYWNSSKYAQAKSSAGFAFSFTPWLRSLGVDDIYLGYLSGYYKISDMAGTVSASLRYFSLGEVVLREDLQAIATSVNPYEMTFDLGYSRLLTENFSMGVVLRFIASDLSAKTDENYYTGYAFTADINGFYQLPIDIATGESKFTLGFNLSNIGTKITYDQGENSNFLPTNLKFGLGYFIPFDDYNRLMISAEVNKYLVPTRYSRFAEGFNKDDESTWQMSTDQYNSISSLKGIGLSFCDAPGGFAEEMKEINWAVGLEYAYNEQFFGRVGYYNEAYEKGNRKYFTVGAGFKLSAFKLDVGYVISVAQTNPLDQTLRFSLGFDIDGLKALADRE